MVDQKSGAMMNRREFLGTASAGTLLAAAQATANARSGRRVLVLGGRGFVGPPTVQALLKRGCQLTLVSRGQTGGDLFPDLPFVKADRTTPEGIRAIAEAAKSGRFNSVIDTWQEDPDVVAKTADAIGDSIPRYLYVSTMSVYGRDNFAREAVDETMRLPTPRAIAAGEALDYTTKKLRAEIALRERLGDRLTVVRPHQVYGRYIAREADGQRYWFVRMRDGGRVLVPGDGDDHVQFVDVLDLAEFIALLVDTDTSGTFNVARRMRWLEYALALQGFAAQPIELFWAPEAFLAEKQVRVFSQMPLWLPRSRAPGFMNIRADKAMKLGLTFRPFADTIRDVLEQSAVLYPNGYDFNVAGKEGHLDSATERRLIDDLITSNRRLRI